MWYSGGTGTEIRVTDPGEEDNNNYREFIEHFWNIKALYNLKKRRKKEKKKEKKCTNTHNYTNL